MSLIEKLEQADGPSRELDAEIAKAVFKLPDWQKDYAPVYTASIDAALTLFDGDWEWLLDNDTSGECAPFRFRLGQFLEGEGATAALAICIAAIKAQGGNHD